jgi:hypothetical protein
VLSVDHGAQIAAPSPPLQLNSQLHVLQ